MDKFFDQWVYNGTDNIYCSYNFSCFEEESQKECVVNIRQEPQDYKEFNFPLEIEFQFVDGTSLLKQVIVDDVIEKYKFNFDKKVETITLDPNSKLLASFEKSYSH